MKEASMDTEAMRSSAYWFDLHDGSLQERGPQAQE